MKYHHAVVSLKNESEPQLRVVCVDPEHKAGTRDQDCPVQEFVADKGWLYFYMMEGKKDIFKFEFHFRAGPFEDSGILYKSEYTPIEGEVHPRGKPS